MYICTAFTYVKTHEMHPELTARILSNERRVLLFKWNFKNQVGKYAGIWTLHLKKQSEDF